MKYYAVKKGRQPGIYRNWEAAQKQVEGFAGAQYQSFTDITKAAAYLNWGPDTQTPAMVKSEDQLKAAINKVQKEAQQQARPYFARIYTDGGSRNTGASVKGGHVRKTDKAAWAYQIKYQGREVHGAGGELGASNNKMEQMALINALKKLQELGFNDKHLLFILDSRYVLNAINQGWLKSWKKRGWKRSGGELANKEQWQEIDRLLPHFPDSTFSWTKGHAGNEGNEFVDHLLNRYMDEKE